VSADVFHVTPHAARFELEHAGGIAALEQLVRKLVVERKIGNVDRHPAQFFYQAQRILDDGQVF